VVRDDTYSDGGFGGALVSLSVIGRGLLSDRRGQLPLKLA
jgi:hypothetical protein